MKGNDHLVEEINKETFRKGGNDADIKQYMLSILYGEGIEGLKDFNKRYSKDFTNAGYDVRKIQADALYIWHGLNEYGGGKT